MWQEEGVQRNNFLPNNHDPICLKKQNDEPIERLAVALCNIYHQTRNTFGIVLLYEIMSVASICTN